MRPDELRDIKSAADYAGRDDRTIRCGQSDMGSGARVDEVRPIEISLPALEMVHGEWEALERLRAGDRSNRCCGGARVSNGQPALETVAGRFT
ncbi:hypothetical protein NKH98_32045 [Mesorhizobium sp. M0833]|uniref:hypothetical protein n=1 Tax=unclassified Mesorhizobium TaxID=325217 RepID=UPI00333B56B7